jgi:lipopolysaccharide biosynthesis protein
MIKPIALYLPQFHSIPENDHAWGEGFTEWTNVRKAKPLFEGHHQPHVPHEDVGYYDLSNPEVMVRQATMAKEYGIYGFAFYHYWFNGKRLLETPLDNMLKTGTPDFPFLYIWANENWSKRWDGSDSVIIQEQHYSDADDLNHIRFLCKNVFCDKRYIKIDNKPVFMVYRTELLPDIKNTALIWRKEAKNYGFDDLYLVRVENFRDDIQPLEIGFDAAMEFAPDVKKSQFDFRNINSNTLIDYKLSVAKRSVKAKKNYTWFRCVFPGWDNSARKSTNAGIFVNSNPQVFKKFLYRATQFTKENLPLDRQYVFINAWNEWAEGCHIEPDKRFGYCYLESVKDVIEGQVNENCNIEFIEESLKELLIVHEQLKDVAIDLKIKLDKAKLSYIKKIFRFLKRKL